MYSSSNSIDDSSNDGEEDVQDDDKCCSTTLLEKTILHLDVDCFYCQVEEIKNPSLVGKPFAVGQKQIIVTSNYVAREFGVQKLMSRKVAKELCPCLIIIEGSDLEPYRIASQSIYKAFRETVKELNNNNSCKKGGMDEYFADITASICEGDQNSYLSRHATSPSPFWIYGEDENSSDVEIREDQSGTSSKIGHLMKSSLINTDWGSAEELKACKTNLLNGAFLAREIQEIIQSKTQFSVTIGISVRCD